MAYSEHLADKVRNLLHYRADTEEKKMFGGLCFMVSGHMCCGIVGDMLMARVGPDNYQHCLDRPHAREMDFTGKPMKGMIYVDHAGLKKDADLEAWLQTCLAFVDSLPPK